MSIATSSIDFESAVASNSTGTFVVVATSQGGGADGDGFGLSARVFGSNGVASTARFQVNTTTAGTQFRPDVAMDASGNFVVVWQGGDDGGIGQDSDGSVGIYGQRFNGLGQKIGSEFQTHNFITGDQVRPAVAMAPDGRFVVVWQDNFGLDTGSSGIFGRLYNADGTANGAEFQINGSQTLFDYLGDQTDPDVAMDASGNFAVTWHNFGTALRLRRFTAAGVSTTNEVDVILNPSNLARLPRIGMDADGDVVVAWEQFNRDGDGFSNRNIYARRYSTNLTPQPLGPDFLVNSTTTSDQEQAAVAMAPGGNFLLSWQSADQDGSLDGIFAQLYNSDGTAAGSEFRVNSTTSNDQRQPEIAFGSDTQAVVTWYGLGVGNPLDVYHQRYSVTAPVIPDDTTVSVDGQNRLLITDTGTVTNDRLTLTLNIAGDVVIVDPNARLGTEIAGAVLSPDAHTLTVPRNRFGTFVQADLRGGFDEFDSSQLTIQTRVFAGAGNDLIRTGPLNDSVNAGSGNDTVYAGNGDDTIKGSDGNDTVFGGNGLDSISGDAGNDRLFGEGGYDTISGGAGDDFVRGGRGEDLLTGDDGNDTLIGDEHDDTLFGGVGNDSLLSGGGNDRVFGDAGADFIRGEAGNDQLFGGDDSDTILGDSGNDLLRGGNGNDSIEGGSGSDTVHGDSGADTIDVEESPNPDGIDTIVNVEVSDTIFKDPDDLII
ncbi:MAG: hypothetical protein O2820_13565 [Planctomycetota bacterium]|nr:hypothetical protein [Planctomycetota bacterium]MDA1250242.1 hypothetical protein [Planctomycetota bacterium]